jgi:uncharacterized damage-inducible protein DinB
MPIRDVFLPEFDYETANTRKTLERFPEDKVAWKPHEKSMTMGRLAGHLAELPAWMTMTLQTDSVDIAPAGGPQFQPKIASTRDDLLAFFDKNIADARAALAAATDEQMMTMPRMAALRTFVMNHSVHHRAQLGVYLRLNNIAVPSLYGPSADEGSMTASA